MIRYKQLYDLANELALSTPGFSETKGPGKGNHATNEFINKLGIITKEQFGTDYSEMHICGNNSLAVDFYFPDDGIKGDGGI